MAVCLFTILAVNIAVEPGDVVLFYSFRIHNQLQKRVIESVLSATG
jgi:hypothetical protein